MGMAGCKLMQDVSQCTRVPGSGTEVYPDKTDSETIL